MPRAKTRPTTAKPRQRRISDAPRVPLAQAEAARRAESRWRDDLARKAGGPLDRATYDCGCGNHFEARVSASVACPACGAPQTW